MSDSYFACLDETPTTGRYVAGPATTGPWAPHLQHGGPPNALAVDAAVRAVRAETGRDDLIALRLAAEFVGPVPVAEVETRARVLRTARSAALAEVTVASGGRDCLLTRVWFVRDADTADVAPASEPPAPLPDEPSTLGIDFGYGASLEWRFVRGAMREPGPAAVWARAPLPLVADRHAHGLALAALVADSGNGVSAALDWSHWSFVNVDLDIHLARPVHGEWLLLDAATQLGANGSALARSTLSDLYGVVGAGLQTLVLARVEQ